LDLLLGYIEQHVGDLAADLLPSLREGDVGLRSADPAQLRRVVEETGRHLIRYARTRDPFHLDDMQRELSTLRPGGLHLSAVVRLLFGLEDLVAIRAIAGARDLEEFIDDLRALRATLREALCTLADRYQQRFVRVSMPAPGLAGTLPVRPSSSIEGTRPPVPDSPTSPPALDSEMLRPSRPVGRAEELRQLWGRLRALSAHPDSVHQVVGIKAVDGLGKTTLVRTFLERVEQRLGHRPVALMAQTARLFELPDWPMAALLRSAFGTALGVAGNEERVARGLADLTDQSGRSLKRHLPWLMRFLGEERADDGGQERSPRSIGLAMRDALVATIEALARRAVDRTGAPLFLVFEDAHELDGPTWTRLGEMLRRVDPTAPIMVLLTYQAQFSVPGEVGRLGGFTEMTLQPFDMEESEQLIDAVLEPNGLEEQTRLRLGLGSQGSPLLLFEAVRQLVEDGVLGRQGRRWMEVSPLPEGAFADLATIVVRRRLGLDDVANEVLEVLAVIEDTIGGRVLEEVASRRGVAADDLVPALGRLESRGLITAELGELGVSARLRHPLVRDEIYRQMGTERRRLLHEDAGEVFLLLRGTSAFPSLAARHLALAGLPARGLDGLITGIRRALRINALPTALELCRQAIGVLNTVEPESLDRYLYAIVRLRERVYARLGATPLRRVDLREAAHLSSTVGTDADRREIGLRAAEISLRRGDLADARARIDAAGQGLTPGDATLARVRLAQALTAWQGGRLAEASTLLVQAVTEAGPEPAWPGALRARLRHAQGIVQAGHRRGPAALAHLFEAWRIHRRRGDPYDEAMVIDTLADVFQAEGRLLDADRLLRRGEGLVRDIGAPRVRARMLLRLGELHAAIGNFDEAEVHFGEALRLVDKASDRVTYAAATIGRGRILVNRGLFDEAMPLLAQCLKDLGREADGERVYVDALVALATNFALFARGEKLVLGGLRYAREAAEKAAAMGHWVGRVRAWVVQVRGLLILERLDEATHALEQLERVCAEALSVDPYLQRMQIEVGWCRYLVARSRGAEAAANSALTEAWDEFTAQLAVLEGSGYERGFVANLVLHRELKQAVDSRAA